MKQSVIQRKLAAFLLLSSAPIIIFYGVLLGEMAADLAAQSVFNLPVEHYAWQVYPHNHHWYLAALVLSIAGIIAWTIGLFVESIAHTTQTAE